MGAFRQNHDAGVSVGVYGADGDDRVLPSLPTMRELAMSRRATELSISIFVIGAALPVLMQGRLPIALAAERR